MRVTKPATKDLVAAEQAYHDFMKALGIDMTSSHAKDTPHRVVGFFDHFTDGLQDPPFKFTAFPKNPSHVYDQLVIVKDIPFYSICVASKQRVNCVAGSKQAARVRVGDKLWTLHDGKVVTTTVKKVEARRVAEIIEVVTEKGTLLTTEDHPFATPQGWCEAKDLKGKLVEWTSPRSLCRGRFVLKEGRALGYFIGATFSDGSCWRNRIRLAVTEKWFADKYVAAIKTAFGLKAEVKSSSSWLSGYRQARIQRYSVTLVSSYLADLVRQWAGGDAHHFRQSFPRCVLSSKEMLAGFLEGYADGDGCETTTGRTIVSANVPFLQELAKVVGARFTPRPDKRASSLHVADRWDSPGWFGKHGFKQERHSSTLLESGYVKVLAVRRKAQVLKPWTVYSFTCEPYPTFLVAGHLTHNCAHHHVPFFGKVHVGYLPNEKIIGLSKIVRAVVWKARKPSIQEDLTEEIASLIMQVLTPRAVCVLIKAEHLCISSRGVQQPGTATVTHCIRGKLSSSIKDEFLTLLKV